MIEITEPASHEDFDQVRGLMRAFVQWARQRYESEIEFVERYFDPVAFEAELSGLPGKYSRPKGCLLLAKEGGRAVGCVAFRDLGNGYCEMKRLYVDPASHGKGAGLALVTRLIDQAKLAGYSAMRLDTGPGQNEAQQLYRKTGFVYVEPYYELPRELAEWLKFMELDLR